MIYLYVSGPFLSQHATSGVRSFPHAAAFCGCCGLESTDQSPSEYRLMTRTPSGRFGPGPGPGRGVGPSPMMPSRGRVLH